MIEQREPWISLCRSSSKRCLASMGNWFVNKKCILPQCM